MNGILLPINSVNIWGTGVEHLWSVPGLEEFVSIFYLGFKDMHLFRRKRPTSLTNVEASLSQILVAYTQKYNMTLNSYTCTCRSSHANARR